MPDRGVQGIAEWAWSRRLEGKIYRARDSEFRVDRTALDAIKGEPHGTEATALYVKLQDIHGHRPEKVFPLDWKAMKSARHIAMPRRNFLGARRLLENFGLLGIADRHSAQNRPRTYRLTRIRSSETVSLFSPSSYPTEEKGERGGAGLRLTHVNQFWSDELRRPARGQRKADDF